MNMEREWKIIVKQVYRVVREIEIPVEGIDKEEAIERIASGETEVPPFEDPRWQTGYDLQNEKYL